MESGNLGICHSSRVDDWFFRRIPLRQESEIRCKDIEFLAGVVILQPFLERNRRGEGLKLENDVKISKNIVGCLLVSEIVSTFATLLKKSRGVAQLVRVRVWGA